MSSSQISAFLVSEVAPPLKHQPATDTAEGSVQLADVGCRLISCRCAFSVWAASDYSNRMAESKSAEFTSKINGPSEFSRYVHPLTALVNFQRSECRYPLPVRNGTIAAGASPGRLHRSRQRAALLLSFRQRSELLTLATVNNDRHSGRYIIIAFIEDRIGAPL
jgi:hypothetical protein